MQRRLAERLGEQVQSRSEAAEAYLLAANAAGGLRIGWLPQKQALLENPSPFMTGLSKLLPMMLEGNPDAPLIVERVYYTGRGLEAHAQACSSISSAVVYARNRASIETWRLADAPIVTWMEQRRGRASTKSSEAAARKKELIPLPTPEVQSRNRS